MGYPETSMVRDCAPEGPRVPPIVARIAVGVLLPVVSVSPFSAFPPARGQASQDGVFLF